MGATELPEPVLMRLNGDLVAYSERGSGSPVVFLHGAGLTHRLWQEQISYLSKDYRCIGIDLRGHGKSHYSSQAEAYSTSIYADDLRKFLDAMSIDRVHVVGLSLGGMIAQEFGLNHPERVKSITTIGTPHHYVPNACLRALLSLGTRYLFVRIDRSGMKWVARSGSRRWGKTPTSRAYLLEESAGNDGEQFKRVWRGVVAYRSSERLPDMKPPILVIAGEKDPNRRYARRGAEAMPNARFEVIERAGHITNKDRPEAVNILLGQWLQEHDK